MKCIFLFLLLSFSFALVASEGAYKVVEKSGTFLLETDHLSWTIPHQAQLPVIKKTQKLDDSHDLVIYLAEEAGTKYSIQSYKAVVVDTKKNKVLTEEPLDFQHILKSSGKVEEEATFRVEKDKLFWTFEGQKKVIPL